MKNNIPQQTLKCIKNNESLIDSQKACSIAKPIPCKADSHQVIVNTITDILAGKKQTLTTSAFTNLKNSGKK